MNNRFMPVFLAIIAFQVSSAFAEQNTNTNMQTEKEKLVKGSQTEQRAAMGRLRNNGKIAIPTLCDVIEKENDYSAKRRAATVLDEVLKSSDAMNEETLSMLERVTKSSDTGISNLGAMAVMHFKGNMRARKILKEAIPTQTKEQLRAQIIEAFMVNIDGDRREIPFITTLMEDKSEYVRVSVAGYLGSLGDVKGLALCNEVLRRKPTDNQTKILQMRAAIAAGRIGDPSIIPILKIIASSSDYGLAQSQARFAIKDIELKHNTKKSGQLEYLKTALSQNENVRWAVQQLVIMNDPESLEILKWAANKKELAGSKEASQTLKALGAVVSKE